LDALHVQGGTAAIPAITDHVVAALQLPPEEAAERDPRHNMNKVEYRLAWARTYLKKFGLAEDVKRGVGFERKRQGHAIIRTFVCPRLWAR